MRAIELQAVNTPLKLVEKQKPEAGKGDVVVKLKAAALNHRDVYIQQGLYPNLKFPVTPGSDGAGVVDETGEGVEESWLGKDVIINTMIGWGENENAPAPDYQIVGMPEDGTLAEYIRVPAANLYPKPPHLNFEQAAALPLGGLTAFRATVVRPQLKTGEKVLVTGAGGGVAQFAVQFAAALGCEVWVTSGSDSKIAKAVEAGVEGGANYTNPHWTKELQKNAGVFDVIVDGAAGEGFNELLKLVSPGGRICMYGGTRGKINGLLPARIFWKQITILGSSMGSDADFEAMLKLVNEKQIIPVIDKVYPLENTAEAFERMEKGHQMGKIVIRL
ncbi:MAG: zinc-binding dehydrogenase [Bacteroidia bacterium]